MTESTKAVLTKALIGVLVALSAGRAMSQEQKFIVEGPTGVLDKAESYVNVSAATLDLGNAAKLIDATFGPAARQTKDFVAIIHVLRWSDAGKVDKQNWYLYSGDGSWSDLQFAGLRIFGSHNVALLFVHLNAPGARLTEVAEVVAGQQVADKLYGRFGAEQTEHKKALLRTALSLQAIPSEDRAEALKSAGKGSLKAPVEKIVNENGWNSLDLASLQNLYIRLVSAEVVATAPVELTRLSSLSNGEDCGLKESGDQRLVKVGEAQVCVPAPYHQTSYTVEVTKKLPSAINDFLRLANPLAISKRDDRKLVPVALWGGRQMRIGPIPSDVKVTPSVTVASSTTILESRTYDNEGRYFWDVSAGLPVRSIRDTAFDQTGGTLTAKKVEKQSLYAMFNVFPFKVDTKGTGYRWLTPTLLAGIGITERPLDRLMAGAGLGLNKVQFFAGWAFTRKNFPGPAGDPAATTSAYRTNLIFGLNIPIRQVIQTLKAAK